MTLIPRPVAAQEYPALGDMWHAAWHETQAPFVPPALVALRTKAEFRSRLAAMGDGLRCIGPVGRPTGLCSIRGDQMDQLFVAPEARGTGAAAALLADAEVRMATAGVTRAHLDCLVENTAARRFYARHGWVEDGIARVVLDTSAGPFPLTCVIFFKTMGIEQRPA